MLNIPQEEKKKIYNVLFLIKNGKVVFKKNKSILPNYGVFDEKRYFYSEEIDTSFYLHKSKKIKFLICEEMWSEKFLKKIMIIMILQFLLMPLLLKLKSSHKELRNLETLLKHLILI